jgi:hypothetical protein
MVVDETTGKLLGEATNIHGAHRIAIAVIYDAASNRVFTFNGDGNSSTVIDHVAGKQITDRRTKEFP